MNTLESGAKWKQWQKILFRFFFIFLSALTIFAYNPAMEVLDFSYRRQAAFFGHLKGLAGWLDNHVFHLAYIPREQAIYFTDTHFGVILTLTILAIAITATVIWTVLDTKRNNYNRLYFWFCNYLAYYIFLAMSAYAIGKIIPVQCSYPEADQLMDRWGAIKNWELLFRFMGTSPLYCMFCGWLELIASLLILFNRTRVIGGILIVLELVNIFLLNIFYNNNVILLSGILLLCSLFIIAGAFPKLYTLFIKLQPVSLGRRRYSFTTPWKKYVMIALCFLPAWKVYKSADICLQYYKGQSINRQKQRLYDVTTFVQGSDTIPPLTTDTTRWKYICFIDYGRDVKRMIKYDMQENKTTYRCRWDTINNTIKFSGYTDTSKIYTFKYKAAGEKMQLKGAWPGKDITMQLTNMPIDSMTLVKDKFLFMQEDE
jgi:hypothetical protein